MGPAAWQDRAMEERTVQSRIAYAGRLLTMRVDDVVLADGRPATREIIEHPGAVGILAWDGERLAAVRQWRQAAGRETLEIPAGTRDPGEEPRQTAERELAEECGVRAETWEQGPGFWTAPGFCTEYLTLWLATDLSRDGRDRAGRRGAGAGVADPRRGAGGRRRRGDQRREVAGRDLLARAPRWAAPRASEPLQPRVLGPAGDPAALGDRFAVDLLQVAGEVDAGWHRRWRSQPRTSRSGPRPP